MKKLVTVNKTMDIPRKYRKTPIGALLEYHNLGRKFDRHEKAQLLIGMCMDNRKHLHMPDNFAFIIRSGGGNLRYSEFKVSYAIAVGGVSHIVLIAHNQCGMVNLITRKEQFVKGLVKNAGWRREDAKEHFEKYSMMFELGDEISFISSEAKRLRARYPNVVVAPMFYRIQDSRLYLIKEG